MIEIFKKQKKGCTHDRKRICKICQRKGHECPNGVAYGSLDGFAATLSEGTGYKQIVFTVTFLDLAKRAELQDRLSGMNLQKTYRVQKLEFSPIAISVTFTDNPGTMKKIAEFLDFFLPLLREHQATGAHICTQCGGQITAGSWVLVNGVAYHVHDACGEKMNREISEGNTARTEQSGNYLSGLLGALLGSALGAVVWGMVLSAGYVASLVGLLIGFLAEKGYNLLHGKQGKGKIWILFLSVVLGVVLGTLGYYYADALNFIRSGEIPELVASDAPMLLKLVFTQDPEFRRGVIADLVTGLLFAALGVAALIHKTKKSVSGDTFFKLK